MFLIMCCASISRRDLYIRHHHFTILAEHPASIYKLLSILNIFIDREAEEIIRLVASVCPFCLSIFWCSPAWTVWPLTLILGMRVDLDLGYLGIVGQGRRSKFQVKLWENVFWHDTLFLKRCQFSPGAEWSAKSPIKHKSGTLLKTL